MMNLSKICFPESKCLKWFFLIIFEAKKVLINWNVDGFLLQFKSVNRLEALSQICLVPDGIFYGGSNVSIYETIKDISPGLSSVMDYDERDFQDRLIEFKPTFTARGLCFTFNSMNSEEIYRDQ